MLERLLCNSCGAPLEVPESANFVRCNHCSTQLAIRREDNVTFTEQLEELTEKTDALADRVDTLTSQNDIAALDREWELDRENYMVSNKHGVRRVPTAGGSVAGGLVAAAFGTFWTVMAFGITSGAPDGGGFSVIKVVFPLFGLIFIGIGVVSAVASFDKASRYQNAERRYQARRSELQSKARD